MDEDEELERMALERRRLDYVQTFEGEQGRAVLKDLALFCRAHETAFHPDARVHAVLEGRREVWLRIQKFLELAPDDLWELYAKRTAPRSG